MIGTQRVALATQLLSDLPSVAGSVVRAAWRQLVDDPAVSLQRLRQSLDDSAIAGIAKRWERLDEYQYLLDKWEGRDVVPIFVDDSAYPSRWREAFGERAPMVVFAWGRVQSLNEPLVGVVGSRNLTDAAGEFADEIGTIAAALGFGIASGAARGADQRAMHASIDAGGTSVGITTELSQLLKSRDLSDRLCLVTPFAPDAGFSVGNAMARNKLIYALGLVTIVVQSDVGAGGTWSGATEAISKGYGRVAAWTKGGPGCEALLSRGGEPIDDPKNLSNLVENRPSKSLFD